MINKIIKHRALIFQVLRYLSKYQVLRILYSDKDFLNKAVITTDLQRSVNKLLPLQPNSDIIRQIDRTINKFLPNTSCLIRSLVKRDILKKRGIETSVCFGLLKEDNIMRAHAWLSAEKSEGFAKVYQTL